MERRLYRAIMTPAMIASWTFGVELAPIAGEAEFGQSWVHAKLLLVVAMSGLHGAMGAWRRDFALDRNRRPARFRRFADEIPTVLMVLIVILVVVKPL